jgi:hypothetical protein
VRRGSDFLAMNIPGYLSTTVDTGDTEDQS